MKKVFFALAVVAMFSFVACNGNAAQEDTTAQEPAQVEELAQEPACDEATDAAACDEAAAETAEATEVAE